VATPLVEFAVMVNVILTRKTALPVCKTAEIAAILIAGSNFHVIMELVIPSLGRVRVLVIGVDQIVQIIIHR